MSACVHFNELLLDPETKNSSHWLFGNFNFDLWMCTE